MAVPRIEVPAASEIDAIISKNTNIPQRAKELILAHRDLLRKFRRKASLPNAQWDVLQSFVENRWERLPHLYGDLADVGPPTSYTAVFGPRHWDWVENMLDLFKEQKPSVGDILASAFLLRLPTDRPLWVPRQAGPREGGGKSAGDDP